jgi:hypothetical protein
MVSLAVSRSMTSTMEISLFGSQPVRHVGRGLLPSDIGARFARYNPEYHTGAVLTCPPPLI